DRNRSHWSTSKTPSYTKSVSWQHHPLHNGIPGHPILVSKPCLMQAIQRPNVTNMRQALLMGEHYSVEIENAEIILDIDTPDDFITAKKRYTEI
ncbi:hypothetical protein RZO92_12755, partial [Escherichia coli]|nr:hypothetical protein [Escherichia coli]